MNHQLIETWLQNPYNLPPEQNSELQAHLAACVECRRIHSGWLSASRLMQATPQIKAPAGFSARFQASLAERRVREHRRQIRTVLLVLLGAILVIAAILLVRFLTSHSAVQVLSQGIEFLSTAPQRYLEIRYIFSFWFSQIPAIYRFGAAIIICTWLFLLLVSWILTISRIKHQGVTQ